MTARDRTVLGVIAMVGALVAFWFLAFAPKRDEATKVADNVEEVRGQLDQVRQAVAAGEAARKRHDEDQAIVARIGKAVPADDEVPALLVQLEKAAEASGVDFRVIKLEGSAAAGAPTVQPAPQAAAEAVQATEGEGGGDAAAPPAPNAVPAESVVAQLPPGATVGPAGFPTMPFSFTFHGTFRKLEKFLDRVRRFTTVKGEDIEVRGRLLTIDAVSLQAGPKGFPQLTAEIKATAYLQPPGEESAAASTAAAAAEKSATGTAPQGAPPVAPATVTPGVTP